VVAQRILQSNGLDPCRWSSGPVPEQEVAYGHAGFLDSSVYANVSWLGWNTIYFRRSWPATTLGAAPGDSLRTHRPTGLMPCGSQTDDAGIWNRVRVRYENGLVVTANGASNVLTAGAWLLPDLGWVAEGAGITAGTNSAGWVVADFADTGDTLFLNARAASTGICPATAASIPASPPFSRPGARAFRVGYKWDVQDRLANDYNCFVHFCTNGIICAQQDHAISPARFAMGAGQAIQRRARGMSPCLAAIRRRL